MGEPGYTISASDLGNLTETLEGLGADAVFLHRGLTRAYGHPYLIIHLSESWPSKSAHRIASALVDDSSAFGAIIEGELCQDYAMPEEDEITRIYGMDPGRDPDARYMKPEPPRLPRGRKAFLGNVARALRGDRASELVSAARERTSRLGISGNGTVPTLDEIWMKIYDKWEPAMIADLIESESPMCTWLSKNQMFISKNEPEEDLEESEYNGEYDESENEDREEEREENYGGQMGRWR